MGDRHMVGEIEDRTECQVIWVRSKGFKTLIDTSSVDCTKEKSDSTVRIGRTGLVTVQPGPQKGKRSMRASNALKPVHLSNDLRMLVVLILQDFI